MPANSIKLDNNQEFRLDARPDRLDLRDRKYQPPLVSLPARWPLRKDIELATITFRELVMNQHKEGACTGFGLAAVINYVNWKNKLFNLPRSDRGLLAINYEQVEIEPVSAYQLYHLARAYDEWEGEDYEGSSCRGAVKGFHKHGVCLWKHWPKKEAPKQAGRNQWQADAATRPLGAYYRVNCKSINDIQAAIFEVGAVYVSSRVHDGWRHIRSKTEFPLIRRKPNFDPVTDFIGLHAYAIIGYEPRGFIIQNSWGTGWGFHGFAILPYSDWAVSATDAWVTAFGAPMQIGGISDVGDARSESQELGSAEFKIDDRTNEPFDVETKFTADNAAALCSFRTEDLSAVANREMAWLWSDISPIDVEGQIRTLESEEAYGLTVVLENDGRPLRRRIGFDRIEDAVGEVVVDLPLQWWEANRFGNERFKLMVFFHGGLNSEKDSINRIRHMAPWFLANRIYPLFLTWRTSFVDSILGILDDNVRQFFGITAQQHRSFGWWSTIKDQISEASDRAIEAACKNLLVKPVWTQMKQNAEAAAVAGHGLSIISFCLEELKERIGDFELHLIGHSAGSLPIGYMLRLLERREIEVSSCRLLAPACTMDFANQYYGNALKKGVLDGDQFHVHVLSDELERQDSVGPYGKSLLYLVSRALEVHHKEPLLGMEGVWRMNDSLSESEMFYIPNSDSHFPGSRLNPSINEWHEEHDFLIPEKNIVVANSPEIRNGSSMIQQNHGNYDNNAELFTEIIKSIRGKADPVVGDLGE